MIELAMTQRLQGFLKDTSFLETFQFNWWHGDNIGDSSGSSCLAG